MTRASSGRNARRKLRRNPPKMIVTVELPESPGTLQQMRITAPDGKVLHEGDADPKVVGLMGGLRSARFTAEVHPQPNAPGKYRLALGTRVGDVI